MRLSWGPVSYTHLDVYKRQAYAIADYLSENCEQNISLEELAAHFYLSKYYVCRTFKEITGYTVTEYTNCLLYTSRCV